LDKTEDKAFDFFSRKGRKGEKESDNVKEDDPAKSQLNVILSKLECSSIHCPHPLIPSP
jgi:hypothetical protein